MTSCHEKPNLSPFCTQTISTKSHQRNFLHFWYLLNGMENSALGVKKNPYDLRVLRHRLSRPLISTFENVCHQVFKTVLYWKLLGVFNLMTSLNDDMVREWSGSNNGQETGALVVLHHLLPPAKPTPYDLRNRTHNRSLPRADNSLRKNFIYRQLYKDIY